MPVGVHDSSQTGLVATKRQEKFKSKQYSLSKNPVFFEENGFKVSFFSRILYLLFLLIYRGSQLLQFTTKLNPRPLIFESHDLHFIIPLKVVNSDRNSITITKLFCIRGFVIIPQNKSF